MAVYSTEYLTDRGIEELVGRRGGELVTPGWLAARPGKPGRSTR
jgi:hypothetical protein